MKNFAKLALLSATLLLGAQAFAAGVGYIDYVKVQENFPLAQNAIKEIDSKALEIQQFMVDKEKQYKVKGYFSCSLRNDRVHCCRSY